MTAAATNLARSRWRAINAEDRAWERAAGDPSSDRLDRSLAPLDSSLTAPIACAVGKLSRRQGQIVVLHYYGDLSLHEIADRLAISEGTVKRTLHDARAELRRSLVLDKTARMQGRQTMMGWHMAGTQPGQYEYALAADRGYEGKSVVRLRCTAAQADGFGTLMQTFSAKKYLEHRVRFSGAIKCKGVEDRVGLWMRVDGERGAILTFDNMEERPIRGTMAWRRYDVVLDVPADATAVALGVLLLGKGAASIADFAVETVGTEVATTGGPFPCLPDGPQNLDFSET